MMVKTRGRDKEWLDTDDFAAIFGVSVTYFRDKIRPLVDGDSVRKRDGKGTALEFHAPTLLRAWKDTFVATARPLKVDADPMLDGDGESEGLERYRMAKAQREELRLDIDRGELAHVNRMEGYLRGALGVIRAAIERLQREFGTKAYEIMEEAVAEADRRVARLAEEHGRIENGDSGDDGSGGSAASVEHPAGEAADDS